MGKRKAFKGKRKGGQEGGARAPRQPSGGGFADIVRDNQSFVDYYKGQNLLSEDEFSTFYDILKTPLPTTFRITGSRKSALDLRDAMESKYVPSLQGLVIDDVSIEPPKPLSWYPNDLGWFFKVSRKELRKSEEVKKFHQFIVSETEVGNISRQEAVSMIPPLLLDVRPHQSVLDMCAAPGSKTGQILEAIHANDRQNELPTGIVIANDADYKRAQMLVHQTKRLQSPCFLVMNHNAQHFPNIHVKHEGSEEMLPLKFDRVLCDVPCSGDGTFRKNEAIWKTWSVGDGLGLHTMQLLILLRGIQLLKVGGRLVYSTCSFNPIENEAVVAALLQQSKGSVRLVDVSENLPQLKRRQGVSHWRVMNKEKEWVESFESIPERQRRRFSPTMFPPSDIDLYHMERCLRIYPHDQDTGGFFVAVLEKTTPMTHTDKLSEALKTTERIDTAAAEQEDEQMLKQLSSIAPEDVAGDVHVRGEDTQDTPVDSAATPSSVSANEIGPENDTAEPPAKRHSTDTSSAVEAKRPRKEKTPTVAPLKEEPFIFLKPENSDIADFSNFYGLDPKFPATSFLVRSEISKNRTIYYVSEAVKNVLSAPDAHRLRVVNTGIKAFVRQENVQGEGSPWRVSSESLSLLEPFMSKRKIIIDEDELRLVVMEVFPKIEHFKADRQQMLNELVPGCAIFEFEPKPDSKLLLRQKLVLPVWKARVSFNVLINKQERKSLAMRLFGELPQDVPPNLQQLTHRLDKVQDGE
ncbi:hypothetical protein BZG36_03041 [Bifiguratus adelaidae]|uniref:SAM-dependent MTase RsmB/NOP-type domain-containing protein n=1 Tax=Bifiguratus adelaidae TaxID=1938954 RepID=A0A261XYY3_9FUNG|nr:hypothetical protein BZG36_03041 [Bifiguratus adelaidae]